VAVETVKNKLFDKFGVILTASYGDDTVRFPAFLQPLRYKNKIYLSGVATELGYDGLNKYLLICPPEINIKDIDGINCRLCLGDEAFGVDHYETVYRFGKAFYLWAIIHKEG
jgi:hypothetical protein